MPLPSIDYDAHPAYVGLAEPSGTLPDEYRARLERALDFVDRFSHAWGQPGRRGSKTTGYDQLVADGITPIPLTSGFKSTLEDLLSPRFEAAATSLNDPERRRAAAVTRFTTDELRQPGNSDVLKAVHALELETSFIDAASAYLGLDAFLQAVHLKTEDAGQPEASGKRGVFGDIGLEDPASVYMHTDATCMNLKMIVYLSPVEAEEDGPFKFCIGSPDAHRCDPETYAKRLATERYCQARDPKSRITLMALPPEYRNRFDFGSDLLEGDPVIGELLASEQTFTTNEADAILFDTSGVHRGAMIQQVVRRVLQVTIQGHR